MSIDVMKQEPVAWGDVKLRSDGKRYCRAVATTDQSNLGYAPLYDHPPAAQRTWVGLTPREIYILWEDSGVPFVDWDSFASITRAIESKLREKNGGAA
jgi:hypothetical protein